MNAKVEQALHAAIRNWESMSKAANEEAEPSADQFESSFYRFIDAVQEWYSALEVRPQTMDDFLMLPMISVIFELLPAPLHLNFETEAELIFDQISRMEEDKYD